MAYATWEEFYKDATRKRDALIAQLQELENKKTDPNVTPYKITWVSRPGDQHISFTYILYGVLVGGYMYFVASDGEEYLDKPLS